MRGSSWPGWMPPALLAAVAVLLFAGTLSAGFTWDDRHAVIGFLSGDRLDLFAHFAEWRRPIRLLSFALDRALFGLSPAGYHAHNLLWHALSVVLLHALVRGLGGRPLFSFVVALLFAAHPIHVEAVANLTNRKELLCMAFTLAATLAYLRFVRTPGGRRWPWLGAAALAWTIAVFSKQVAIVLPLTLVAYEWLFLPPERRFLLRSPVWLVGAGALGAVLVGVWAFLLLDFTDPAQVRTFAGYSGEPTLVSVALTSARAFWSYVGLLVWPAGLCPDHVVELSRSPLELRTALAWLGLAGVLALTWRLGRRAPMATFGLLWLLVHFLPVANLVPSVFVLADRYMYVPSAGFCIVLVCAGDRLRGALAAAAPGLARMATAAALTVVATGYALRTVDYADRWSSQREICEYALECNPRSFRAHHSLGHLELAEGRFEEAARHYTRVIELKPRLGQAWNNRGTAHAELGLLDAAAHDFETAAVLDPTNAGAHFNLGYLHLLRGDVARAERSFAAAAELGLPAARAALQDLRTAPDAALPEATPSAHSIDARRASGSSTP